MTVGVTRPFRCVCGAAGGDIGELEEHILTFRAGHKPAAEEHWTDRVRDHVARQERVAAVRQSLADSLGISVEELREALR